jgi:hypothetical protein
MKYAFIAQLYWPIWLMLEGLGQPALGIVCGAVVSLIAMTFVWGLEFVFQDSQE